MNGSFYIRRFHGGEYYIAGKDIGYILTVGPGRDGIPFSVIYKIINRLNNSPLSVQAARLDPAGPTAGLRKLIMQYILIEREG